MLAIRKRGSIHHCRGTVRVGKKIEIVKEHSTGCRQRAAAEAYKARLEHEIRQTLLYGAAAQSQQFTFADAAQKYLDRPGGLHRMDVWRIGELNDALGDCSVSDLTHGWNAFKSARCDGLAAATVDQFRATLQAAVNHACREWGIDPPKIQRIKFSNDRRSA